jgi:hypothetical protein
MVTDKMDVVNATMQSIVRRLYTNVYTVHTKKWEERAQDGGGGWENFSHGDVLIGSGSIPSLPGRPQRLISLLPMGRPKLLPHSSY